LLDLVHGFRQTGSAIQSPCHLLQPEPRQRLVIEPSHTMVRRKAFQASAHAVHRRFKVRSIQINHCDRDMIAMMKLFLTKQAALQAVDQREDFGVSHLSWLQRKTPAGNWTDGRDLCSFPE